MTVKFKIGKHRETQVQKHSQQNKKAPWTNGVALGYVLQFKNSRQVPIRNLVHAGTVLGTEVTPVTKAENFFS